MRSIKDTCNRTIWIEKGELRADGETDEVVKEYVKHK
jgi:teichoic acid transport system ATP-binding protein